MRNTLLKIVKPMNKNSKYSLYVKLFIKSEYQLNIVCTRIIHRNRKKTNTKTHTNTHKNSEMGMVTHDKAAYGQNLVENIFALLKRKVCLQNIGGQTSGFTIDYCLIFVFFQVLFLHFMYKTKIRVIEQTFRTESRHFFSKFLR